MLFVWSALLVAVDQATKLWAQHRFGRHGEELAVGLGFSLTYTENTGASFGILRDLQIPIGPIVLEGTLALGILSAAVSAAIVAYLIRRGATLDRLSRIALTLVLAGAVGNMIDRFRLRYVIDFIHFQVGAFDFPVFNFADAFVVVGAGLLLLHGFGGERRASRAESQPDAETRSAPSEREAEPPLEDAERR